MKKGIAAILLLFYFAFSTGIVISYHYCMDEFDSLQLGDKKTDICGRCGMHTDNMGCCNDQVKIFKIQDDQQTAAINFKFAAPDMIIEAFPVFNQTPVISTHQVFANNHSPPLSKQDTYLQNCVFRI
jgi:hypothetical protein